MTLVQFVIAILLYSLLGVFVFTRESVLRALKETIEDIRRMIEGE